MASAASGSSSAPKQKQSLSAEVEAIAQELKKYTENLTGTLQKSINEQNNMMKTAVAMGEASSKMAAKLKRIHNSVAKEQAELREERKKNQEELRKLEQMSSKAKELGETTIRLNVGGGLFEASLETLTNTPRPNFFSAFLCGSLPATPKEDGRYFIDRSPAVFEFVLAFLRNPANPALQKAILALPAAERALLADDASYYMVEGLYDLLAHGAQRPERCFAPEDAATKREEDRARAALARDATAAVAEHGPHWLLLDVFGGPRGAASAGFEYVAGPPPYPLVFDHCPREYRPPLAVAPTLDAFKQNLRYVSGGLLQNLDWSNLLLAGGAVVASLMPTPPSLAVTGHPMYDERSMSSWFRGSNWRRGTGERPRGAPVGKSGFGQTDLDFFVYGLTPEEATAKVEQVCAQIRSSLTSRNPLGEEPDGQSTDMLVVRTKHAVTLVTTPNRPHLQIVLRVYSCPAEILMGFDIDVCAVGFDGSRVLALPRARRALTRHYNLVDLGRMSQTFEVRLAKYAKRGFAVAIPGFDRTLVDFQLFKIPVKEAHGLGKLLLMEMGDLMKHPLLFEVTVPPPQRRVGEGFAPWMFPLYQDAMEDLQAMLNDPQNAIADDFLSRQPSDYCSVFLPSGHGWTAEDVFKLLLFRRLLERSKAMSYVYSSYWRQRNPNSPWANGPRPHTYVYDFLTGKTPRAVFGPTSNLSRTAQLGTKLRYVLDASDFEGELGVPAKLEWITVDPGRQYVTGSFHPVDHEQKNWFQQAYRKGLAGGADEGGEEEGEEDGGASSSGGGGGGAPATPDPAVLAVAVAMLTAAASVAVTGKFGEAASSAGASAASGAQEGGGDEVSSTGSAPRLSPRSSPTPGEKNS